MAHKSSLKKQVSVRHSIPAMAVLAITMTCAQGAFVGVNLGSASDFSVLAGAAVTNTGPTVVSGDIGALAGISGFPPGITLGGLHLADGVFDAGLLDLGAAYDSAAAEQCGTVLTGQDLGVLTISPGVSCYASSAQLTGTVNFDALGNPNAVFLVQIGSTLTTASNSVVAFLNGASGRNVYWQVGSSATLGTGTDFAGSILALTSITLTTGASIEDGRALARNGSVTLDTNNIESVPEPSTCFVVASSLLILWPRVRRRLNIKPAL
jgi:hypothetical protein